MMRTSNEWPQQIQQQQLLHHDEQKSSTSVMPPSSSSSTMEKTTTTNQAGAAVADPHPLKCPRCDSSNTKFCYYNNYSLSQPRHFCKACKRYWTRGGTLRNVPVGGGCRKNKKLRRTTTGGGSSGGGGGGNGSTSAATANPSSISSTALAQARSDLNGSSLFYSPLELNFPFSSYNSTTRVSSSDHHDATRFDLEPQMSNGLGLGFSSDGFIRHVQDGFPGNNNSNNNNNSNSIFFGSSTFASTSTMASLLASSLQHQKFGINTTTTAASKNNIQGGYNNEDTQMLNNGNGSGWNVNPGPNEQISDPSSLLWNASNLGGWFDPSSNMGSSSVPSLI